MLAAFIHTEALGLFYGSCASESIITLYADLQYSVHRHEMLCALPHTALDTNWKYHSAVCCTLVVDNKEERQQRR